jgi:hypothetical protein
MGVNFTVDTLVPYLIERQLVTPAAIVEGDLEVIDAGRRNQNLKVIRQHGASYLIKQPGEGERGTLGTVRLEASFYEHCHSDQDAVGIRGILPGYHSFDAERGLVVMELVKGAPLWAHSAAPPEPEFLAESAGPLGEAVGTIHRTFRSASSRRAAWMAGLQDAPPWVLSAHQPTPDIFASLSAANLKVLQQLQMNESMSAGLESLRAEWSADTLIHNDLKGDNVLVSRNEDGHLSVRIVDWEMIQVGDAAWDVAAVFRDFLGYWLQSVPLTADLTPEQMLEGATWPLAKLHPAMRSFWEAYRASAGLDVANTGAFLLRALRLAAARMTQNAYELSLSAQQPSNLAMALLQLTANILADPREASLHLFGIPAPWRKQPAYATSAR